MAKRRIDEGEATGLLKQALNEIPRLKELRHDNQAVKLWHDKVFAIIDAGLDQCDRATFLVSGPSSVGFRSLSDSDRQKRHVEDLQGHETALKSIIQKHEILAKEESHSEAVESQKSSVTYGERTPEEKIKQLEQFLQELERFRDLQIAAGDQRPDPELDELRTKLVRKSAQMKELLLPNGGQLVVIQFNEDFDAFDTAFTKPIYPWGIAAQWHAVVNCLIQKTNETIGKLEITPPQEAPRETIYSSGTPYDAYRDIKQIVSLATRRLVIVDPYVDSTVVTLIENVQPGVHVQVLTRKMQGDFQLAGQKFKEQREKAKQGTLEVRTSGKLHDRFVFADDKFFHLGASIKDAGMKMCAISEFEDSDIKSKLSETISDYWAEAGIVL